ncbi:hypothetical protein KIN20_022027 [Parelaphostrongylus tenuis]|uniref:Uncharacterized protein n=1 Tax=Parelaphostrongylus tenuis TaxID=148309 RepID=A0AAD5MPN9_PARTN|nr:hypothetical protein KIN20_022027 [Parelaphostrongylus tenuis]
MGQFPSLHGRGKERKANATTSASFVEIDRAPPVPRSRHDHFMSMYSEIMKRKGIIPDVFLVYEKPSTQYVDEDGDVAHEFYAEKESTNGQPRRLHRILNNLRPKGKERYPIPRLSSDVPVVMWEVGQET